ncbi:unnamed protein product [Spirodela intermedia]|uniref:Uncharacterized protein n=1 Tax=Spirodela intermedia TaxID=51605 RepID=A0A7I8IPT8_SPIIN|nr:unnamed protein product [Spirodela intermedia]CAA6659791.1 unnamed protein product [Spirodela intermedia]
MEVGACQGASSSSLRSKRRLFIASVTTLACMTTPCPIASWPPVTWKGSGAHVPLSVQVKSLEPCLWLLPDCTFDPVGAQLAGGSLYFAIFYFLFFHLSQK